MIPLALKQSAYLIIYTHIYIYICVYAYIQGIYVKADNNFNNFISTAKYCQHYSLVNKTTMKTQGYLYQAFKSILTISHA